jgi:hypothetical protein
MTKSEKTRKAVVDAHNSRTQIGNHNGSFDYPSSKGLGIDIVDYWRRNPHPTERNPLPIKVKMKDLKHSIIHDLREASQRGELQTELIRHVGLLEKGQLADKATIQMLKARAGGLTGRPVKDAEELDPICLLIGECGPRAL